MMKSNLAVLMASATEGPLKQKQVADATGIRPATISDIYHSRMKRMDMEVLEKAYDSVQQGARGIIFGRNIFMADNPKILTKALNDVINKDVTPKEAAKKYKLK